jgi:Ulp1 family protease
LKDEEYKEVHDQPEDQQNMLSKALENCRVSLDDEEDWDFDSYSIKDQTKVIEYQYKSHNRILSIDFSRSDIARLNAGNQLNDKIINFYLKYLEQEVIPESIKSKIFICSSYFYQKLTQKGDIESYKSVCRWTKDIDILSKDFIIMPICEKAHWWLAIICYPYAIFENAIEFYGLKKALYSKQSSLIFLTSAGSKEEEFKEAETVLKQYIKLEYTSRKALRNSAIDKYEGYNKEFIAWLPKVLSEYKSRYQSRVIRMTVECLYCNM